jgi:hypothetical protein
MLISFYPLLKIEHLSVDTKLTLYEASIRFRLTYAVLAWEFAASSNLLKWHNKVLCTIVSVPRRTATRDLHMAFKIPYLYAFVMKLYRRQATVILNHDNVTIPDIG